MSAVIIPARFGSTRFPGKVVADIGGLPMIRRVAMQALKSKASKVIVVTDDEKVSDACSGLERLEVMMSPIELATGTDRVAFASKLIDDDIIINVQGDEPFIPHNLIDSLIDGLSADKSLNMITAATKFDDEASSQAAQAVKVVTDIHGFALYFSRYSIPYNRDKGQITRYRHIGIYGFRKSFLQRFTTLERTSLEIAENLEQLRALENGERIKVIFTDYNPISIDTPEDLARAVNYIKERSL